METSDKVVNNEAHATNRCKELAEAVCLTASSTIDDCVLLLSALARYHSFLIS